MGFRYLWTTIDEFILHESNILNKDVEVSFQYPVYLQANLLGLGWLYNFNYAFDMKHKKFYLQRRETNSLRQAILQNANASFTIFDTSDRDVIVLAINDTSSYYEAGLRLYDRILSVDGKDFDSKYIKEKAIGDTIQITISRFSKDTLLLKAIKM